VLHHRVRRWVRFHVAGVDKKTYEMAGNSPANVPGSYKDPGFGWMAGFMAAISFSGLLSLIPLRKVLVIDYKLTYPSGTATAILINGFHSKQGDKNAKYGFHHPHLSSLMFIFRLPLVQSSLDE